MKTSRLFVFGGALLLGVSLVFCSAIQAMETTSRYRGRTIRNFDKFKESVSQNAGKLLRFTPLSQEEPTSYESAQEKISNAKKVRASTKSEGLKLNNQVQKTLQAKTLEFTNFSAASVPFYVSLPKGFSVTNDTLGLNIGLFEASDGDTRLKLAATGTRCDGGVTYTEQCLREKAKLEEDKLLANFPDMQVLQTKLITLRTTDATRFDKSNTGKFFVLSDMNTRRGILTFFDPDNEFVWYLFLEAPNDAGMILNDNGIQKRVFESLFIKPSETPIKTRNVISYPGRRSTSYRSDQAPIQYTSEGNAFFEAKNVPFAIDLPKGFSITSDDIDFTTGQIVFDSIDSKIVISATEDICESQTRSIVQDCVEQEGMSASQDLLRSWPGSLILQDANMMLRLTSQANVAENIGRFYMIQQDGERAAVLTFIEPLEKHVWHMNIQSPATRRDSLLTDTINIKKLISSMRFTAGQ